jgi:tetratricopeptide (TPR) repeat protein
MNSFERGNHLYNSQNYKSAIGSYRKAAKLKENEAYALFNAATCHIKLKQYSEAIPFLKDAIAIKPDSKFYYNLGYCYLHTKDLKKALIHFNTAWALDPKDMESEKAINIILKTILK